MAYVMLLQTTFLEVTPESSSSLLTKKDPT